MGDSRTYIRLHDGMPDHPKVVGLSDSGFRLYVEALCWCSRHLTDGVIPEAALRKLGSPKARREVADAGLIEMNGSGWHLHDYLQHQRSAAQVAAAKEQRRQAGKAGGKARGKRVASESLSEPSSENEAKSKQSTETEGSLREPSVPSGTTPQKTSSSSGGRATQAPKAFAVTDDQRKWAAQKCPGVDVDRETEKFLSWAKSKGKTFKDWNQAWRNWLLKSSDYAAERRPQQQPASDRSELPEAWR